MKRLFAALFAFIGVVVMVVSVRSDQPNALRDFMRVKLSHSQKVLEGLTTVDFDLIVKNSQAMSLLSQESNWKVLQTQDYLDRSREFRRTCDALTEAARKKNLDGAALAYLDLTMKCINCHKYVRGVRTTTTNASPRFDR